MTRTAKSRSASISSWRTLAKAPRSTTIGPSAPRWRSRKNSRNRTSTFQTFEERTRHADSDLSVLRRSHRRGARVLQENARRRGRDADALQGRAAGGQARLRARVRKQGDALLLQARRPARDGLRWPQ